MFFPQIEDVVESAELRVTELEAPVHAVFLLRAGGGGVLLLPLGPGVVCPRRLQHFEEPLAAILRLLVSGPLLAEPVHNEIVDNLGGGRPADQLVNERHGEHIAFFGLIQMPHALLIRVVENIFEGVEVSVRTALALKMALLHLLASVSEADDVLGRVHAAGKLVQRLSEILLVMNSGRAGHRGCGLERPDLAVRLLLHNNRGMALHIVLVLGKVVIHRDLLVLVYLVMADDMLAVIGLLAENAAGVRWREGVVDLTLAAKRLVLLSGNGLAAGGPGLLLLAVAVGPLVLDGKCDLILRHVVHHGADGLAPGSRIAVSCLVNGPHGDELFLAGHLPAAVIGEKLERRGLTLLLVLFQIQALGPFRDEALLFVGCARLRLFDLRYFL